MALVSVAEASQRLGLTQDTVKRRLRKGELQGERHPRPQGYVWVVELAEETIDDDSTTSTQGDDRVRQGVSNGEVRRLEEMVSMLQGQVTAQQEQLEGRGREVQELHVLLQRAQEQVQAALPVPKENRHAWWKFW